MIDKIKKFAEGLRRKKELKTFDKKILSAPRKKRPEIFNGLNLMTRKDRRIAMRRILKRDGIKRPKYMSPHKLRQYWKDCRDVVPEEMAAIRKEANGQK